ncbi:hypothetical protein ABLE93_00380 [Xanthobacter sp. KR7-65]|uniref:hypothetical protein n=1 Tax=Xanthobacter sp. KR7-65 TaxID=3156612 RepID=UPI0032B347B4
MSGLAERVADTLGYGLPWWVWSLPGVAAVVLLLRLFGPKAAAAAAVALALILAHRRGAQAGRDHALKEGERDATKSLAAAEAARAAAARRDGTAGRLRDDDGFRRD